MMMKSDDSRGMVKVSFRLEPDEDGYPPADWEDLWAEQVSNESYRLDNAPFFAKGVACGDLVRVQRDGRRLNYCEVLETQGHSTLRVIVFDVTLVRELRDRLLEMGCTTELSHVSRLISVDVPPKAALQPIIDMLALGEEEGKWEYEEAALRQ
jgi:hypothetical protein